MASCKKYLDVSFTHYNPFGAGDDPCEREMHLYNTPANLYQPVFLGYRAYPDFWGKKRSCDTLRDLFTKMRAFSWRISAEHAHSSAGMWTASVSPMDSTTVTSSLISLTHSAPVSIDLTTNSKTKTELTTLRKFTRGLHQGKDQRRRARRQRICRAF